MAPTDITLYGLSTCDTCKKAQKALLAAGRTVVFRDVRAQPLSDAERARFVAEFGDAIVNRASTTWRGLSDFARESEPEDQLAAHPTLMKRPVIEAEGRLWLGWTDAVQAALTE